MLSARLRKCVVAVLVISAAGELKGADQVVSDPGDNGSPGQLRAKISAAQGSGGGTITFNVGTATIVLTDPSGILPAITTNITVDGGNVVSISGNNSSPAFQITSTGTLTLNNLTITHCSNPSGDGGAIRNGSTAGNGGTLNITNCKFLTNTAATAFSGGAIVSYGPLNIANSEFGSNQAGNGGAVYPRFAQTVTTITGCNFHDNSTLNTTNGWGGAMLIWDGAQVTVTNSQFINNMANSGNFSSSTIDRGGAIYVTFNSTLTVNNCQFASNSAFFGGALYVDPGGTATLTNSDLHNNSIGVFDGTQGGGAIYNAGTLTVDTSQLHDNHADGGGGAIDNVSPGFMVVHNSALRHNQADSGGGIENGSNATVQTTTVADNTATNYGGAIDCGDHTDTSKSLTITDSTLSGNSAGLFGGAILSEMKLTLTNVTISGNSGPDILDHFERQLTLTNVTIAQNTGTGLSLNANPTLTMRNTLLASNSGGNCGSTVTSSGFNLADDTSCGLANTGDHQGPAFNPQLGPLENNGGPTATQLPYPGSPAIDGGTNSGAPSTDQRGYARAGSAPDIGATELQPGLMLNISTRAFGQTGDNVIIAGFIINGSGNKTVVIRAIGPSLAQPPFNVPNAMADPVLQLHEPDGSVVTNDNWQQAANAGSIPSGLQPLNPNESAILVSLPPGAYTAIVRGANNTSGNALAEVYDLDSPPVSKLSNISTRAFVQTGDGVMIGGIIVQGSDNVVVVRALGPSLEQAPFNVPNVLTNPTVSLFDSSGTMIDFNDNWQDTNAAAIQSTGLAPSNPAESAILRNLTPGNYTAIVRGKDSGTGNALVEVYQRN